MYIKGVYKKTIYSSENYTVGLIKIKDNDIDEGLNERTITFTGYFSNINIDDNLKLNGTFTHHFKYGDQFTVESYEIIIPEEKDGIITFLSSDIFPGIGEGKAKKIYDIFKDNTIDIIINDTDKLKEIKGLTKKNITILHDKLIEYQDSIDVIVKLNEYGFNNRDSTTLYNKYKRKILEILDNNIYDLIDEKFYYNKIDLLALRHNYDFFDKRRIKATVIYVMMEVVNDIGDTYLSYSDIYDYLVRALKKEVAYPLYEEIMEELLNESKIIFDDDKYYLTKIYYAEKNIAKRFVYLNNVKKTKNKKIVDVYNKISVNNDIIYNQKQEEAILSAFDKEFLIITGGPGTGKTTIIKCILDIFRELHKKELYWEDKITFLAPTGRAAKKVMEKVDFEASTIHRFLKWNKDNNTFGVNEYNKVKTEMVIIDEASMVDTYLMDNLLKGLYYDTKIILVGDYNQLPSVGMGQVLKDLILTEKFTVVELNELYRQEENSNIISLAYDINNGIYNSNLFNLNDDLTYINADSYNLYEKFSEICMAYKDYNYNDLIILAPMYKTVNGIDNLNQIAKEIFNPKDGQNEIVIGDTKYREGDKVIELVNMPDEGIYNGDIGIIREIDKEKGELLIDYDDNLVKYNKSNYLNFRLGYVTSIHKSQGSEYNVVIIIMLNEYTRMLYRKLLYTGVTRAKKNLFIIGEESAIKKAIDSNDIKPRHTTLLNMVNKMYEEVSIK